MSRSGTLADKAIFLPGSSGRTAYVQTCTKWRLTHEKLNFYDIQIMMVNVTPLARPAICGGVLEIAIHNNLIKRMYDEKVPR